MTSVSKYSLPVGIALVIANMIGTGVFTSIGYQVGPLPSGFVIMMLWLLGGVIAWCGALTYVEIATTLKRSGGEYLFLSKQFHPALGFVSGWISILAGFGGAISAVAIAIGSYSSMVLDVPEKLVSVLCILLITCVHLLGVKTGGTAQTILTTLKLSLIIFFCIAPFLTGEGSGISFAPKEGDLDLILSPSFAVGLVFVVYAYTGWNAAAYIAGNLDNPEKNLPKALLIGTGTVIIIYLALNGSFLLTSGFSELEGQNDVGNVVAVKLFGSEIGKIFSVLFSVALLSTLSAMIIAGSRVNEAMGEDYTYLRALTRKNRFDMPYWSVLLLAGWSVILVLVSSFEAIIQYISVSLSFFSLLTVAGIFSLRKKHKIRPFNIPLYPVPPLIFIGITCWMIYYMFQEDSRIIYYTVCTMVPGLILFFVIRKSEVKA